MKKFLFFLLILSVNTLLFSQEKSLLWEISGNGLEKSSYIYGTMHVSNKIAFRLDDVFYEALNKSECIALESDPTEWLKFMHEDFSFNAGIEDYFYSNNFYSRLFKLEALNPMYIRSVIRFDNHLINNYLYRKDSYSDNFEEETYLDMFIYQAAKKNQKPVIGLEDFKESRYLTTKANYNPNKRQPDTWFMKFMKNKNTFLFQEDVYRERDIELLDSIGSAINTNFYREHMLFKRNENMVNVLDSIMREKAVFSGVGAAHLGGNKGMLNMLRERGYILKPLTSKQSKFADQEKNKLENLFTKPELSYHATSDGFINIKSFDELREFVSNDIKYYIAPDMTNGAYLSINRLNLFEYLPNKKEKVDLDYIKNLLYEDIPGTIVEKEEFNAPFPGISILNKTKKGDYQKYHIYKTPLEIIVIKFGGKSDFVLKHETAIFDSIKFKPYTNELIAFNDPSKKYSFTFPQNYITDNLDHTGKKLIQAVHDKDYYFFQESPYHDVEYIEEDAFEAKFIHTNFYKDIDIKETDGNFVNESYKSYMSSAIIDSLNNRRLWLKSIVKNGSYYLLGYSGDDKNKAQSFFSSLKFKTPFYESLEHVKDTSLHFVVNSPIKAPLAYPEYSYKKKKPYDEHIKNTAYTSKANEKIFVTRTKFHDLKMYENVDSLWNSLNRKQKFPNLRSLNSDRKLNPVNEKRFSKNGANILTYKLRDSGSNKDILVKYIQKKGVLYKLSTLKDSINEPSKFITDFFSFFEPKDTLLGKDIFKDKTQVFFDALKDNDSIALNGYSELKFSKKHTPQIIEILEKYKFPENKLIIKNYLLRTLINKDKSELVNNFIQKLYLKSYSDPVTQRIILNSLFERKNKDSYAFLLKLMKADLPLGSKTPSFGSYHTKADSLKTVKLLFPELLNFSTVEEYKNPIYRLLTKLLDSNVVKPKVYRSFKNQIISDAKIQIKRSIANKKNYSYTPRKDYTLDNYTKILFPFRNERPVREFYLRLLDSENWEALTTYYTLLKKENEIIVNTLKSKTLLNESAQYLLYSKLKNNKISDKEVTDIIDLKTFAKSKLFSRFNYRDLQNPIDFLEEQSFETDNGKHIRLFIFKQKNNNHNNQNKFLHFIAFEEKKSDGFKISPYYISNKRGVSVYGIKTDKEIIDETITYIKHKTRKRIEKRY